ncbi:MAG: hypothetical protein ACRESK_02030, partial [Gammaproteobacteria bacterium]
FVPFHQDAVNQGVDAFGIPKHAFYQGDLEYIVPFSGGSLPENQDFNIDPVELLQHQIDSGGEVIQLKKTKMTFQQGMNFNVYLNDEVPFSIFVPTTQHIVTWNLVPLPNWHYLETLKGKVNNAPFILRGFAYPWETLLYLGYAAAQTVMSDGARAWQLGLKFSVKMVEAEDDKYDWGHPYGGHNHFYVEEGTPPGFYRIKADDPDETPPYKPDDLSPLFQSGTA